MRKILILMLLLLALIVLPTASARANSAPPPARFWFAFEDEFGQPLSPQGVQLMGCDGDCQQGTLLQSYGVCDQPGCLPGAPTLSGVQSHFACSPAQPGWDAIPSQNSRYATVGLCRSSSYDYSGQYRLVAQIDGQVYSSEPRPFFEQEYEIGWNEAFRVVVSPSGWPW